MVIGGSFIGLEAAASLIARGASVDLVTPEDAPLAGIVGEDISARIQQAHLAGGVVLHLGREVQSVDAGRVLLDDGTLLEGDVVLAGIGVEPRTALLDPTAAEVDDGVAVDTAFHALDADGQPIDHLLVLGDLARARVGDGRARIEHVSVAISHGMAAADALLGMKGATPGVPFFCTAQHDVSLRYVGHATEPDRFELDGDPSADDCTAKVWQDGRIAAVITLGRDDVALRANLALERDDQAALAAL